MYEIYLVKDVFVPGGVPMHTYVERADVIEKRLAESFFDNKQVVMFIGPTKIGKSVVAQKVIPKDKAIWMEGGRIDSIDDLYEQIVARLGLFTESKLTEEGAKTTDFSISNEGEVNALVAKGKGGAQANFGSVTKSAEQKGVVLSNKTVALNEMERHSYPFIIDDFHYMDENTKTSLVRQIKPLVAAGVPVMFIGIPHKGFDVEKVETDMQGRVERIEMPAWSADELAQIPTVGFKLLRVDVSPEVVDQLVECSFGSPHLMQELCLELSRTFGISNTGDQVVKIDEIPEGVLKKVAERSGKTTYDVLARGPRQRKDRIERELSNGETVDIYGATLAVLRNLVGRKSDFTIEEIRQEIRNTVKVHVPNANEVSRVLEKMTEIASKTPGDPVFEWDSATQILHIIDPFFVFYLKFGSG